MASPYFARAFGLVWRADTPLPLFTAMSDGSTAPDVVVERIDTLPSRAGGLVINNGEVFDNGVRFRFGDTLFDIVDGHYVRWSAPSARDLPLAFYGTVTSLLLAWRGLVPLHGSAVAIDGMGVVIAGRSGAGKSTLCHALTECGAQLISDDLSALLPMTDGSVPSLIPGRPAIRLIAPGRSGAEGKLLVSPGMVPQQHPISFTHLLLLQDAPLAPGLAAAAHILSGQLFRPRWMRTIPGAAARRATLFLAAQRIAIRVLPPASTTPDVPVADKAASVMAMLRDRPVDTRGFAP